MKIYNPATCSCSPFRLCCPKVKNWVEREVDAAWGFGGRSQAVVGGWSVWEDSK